jgi:23S rRNA (adenine2030-N6)-methyltransferase
VNYRHAFHAGNFADVLKHALLVRLLRALQRKEKGFVFVDTHAGRGRYDLSEALQGDSMARKAEWPDGIGRLWGRTDAPAEVMEYLGLVRAFDRARGNLGDTPRFYPGSPSIARQLARPQDRLELWERHPSECAALRGDFEGLRRVSVHEADGYGATRACLPPPERRALVLIDPPFESQDEARDAAGSIGEGLDRFPSGVYAVWYPVTERAAIETVVELLGRRKTASLDVCLILDPQAAGMRGCGLLIANPPWGFDGEARNVVAYLAKTLCRLEPAQGSVRWVVSK